MPIATRSGSKTVKWLKGLGIITQRRKSNEPIWPLKYSCAQGSQTSTPVPVGLSTSHPPLSPHFLHFYIPLNQGPRRKGLERKISISLLPTAQLPGLHGLPWDEGHRQSSQPLGRLTPTHKRAALYRGMLPIIFFFKKTNS